MQTNLLTSACMQGILMSLVANPINFSSISVNGPLQIVILIYWPCVQKNGGSNYIWLPSPLRWRRWYLFLVVWRSAFDGEHHWGRPRQVVRKCRLQAETTALFASRKSFTSTTITNAVRWLLEEDDGEAESAKSEIMVASSMLLWFDASLLCDLW